jgi:hypothetical protein
MVRTFLIRGLLCGVVAGVLVFLFAKFVGEPNVDGAIAIEDAVAKAAGEAPEPELVSRGLQAGWGLFTGTMLFSIAMGGIFSLVFAFFWGRLAGLGARASSLLIAAAAFVVVYLVPFFKYPANPPSVGSAETIGHRTFLYFGMIAISIVALVVVYNLGRNLAQKNDRWSVLLVCGAAYLIIVAFAYAVLPTIDEVPQQFPASLLWNFRVSALGMQAILWVVLGLLFGELTERSLSRSSIGAARRA